MAEWLWEGFESLVVLDTETTGIDPARERVIELAALKITPAGGEESFDLLVSLRKAAGAAVHIAPDGHH